MVRVIALCLILILTNLEVDGGTFTNVPPKDYNRRSGLHDCIDRFYSNTSFAPRPGIYNGIPVEPGEYSAFAAIGWTRSLQKVDYLCGGTLITLNFVLTAAHCSINGEQKRPDLVRLGDVNLLSDENDENVQQIAIKRFIKHPAYKASRSYNDIALIELETDIQPGPFVCSACLWADKIMDFDMLTVMGFGTTKLGSDMSPILMKADLPPLQEADCKDQFPINRRIAEGIKESQFCAASPNKDACPGDSGGPILVNLVDPNPHGLQKLIPFVTGIISIGTGCNEGSIGLYSRVASYIEWIQNVTNVSFDPKSCARNTECVPFYKDVSSSVQRPEFAPEYHVDLMNDKSKNPVCAGALIDYRHVLTSYECILAEPTFVLLDGARANITDITNHDDLAIIGLDQYYDTKPEYFKTSGPVCLLKKSNVTNFKILVSANDPENHQRLIVNALVMPDNQCKPGFICTEKEEYLIPETCVFQPGGSIASHIRVGDNFNIPLLHGINLEELSCGNRKVQLKAASVAHYYPWIESVVLGHIVESLKKEETFRQHEYFRGDTCLPASGGGLGRCVPADHCEELLKDHRKGLVNIRTCLFEGDQPIVCCPNVYL
ncbi:uncharacterized protein LOC5565742 [Aedes aegypti]|uniref:Uncharacterized protein n=1 Tax=Aedes aegypti TaxID=7159 RepID=A0A1S4F9D7_AEDAE|nr:uncharacterized protein LOC5565742 [Aedes aegypti]